MPAVSQKTIPPIMRVVKKDEVDFLKRTDEQLSVSLDSKYTCDNCGCKYQPWYERPTIIDGQTLCPRCATPSSI